MSDKLARDGGGAPTKNMVLRLDPDLAERLAGIAEVEGRSVSDVAREAILSQRERLRFEFSEVDIEADDELELEYGIRIPVVEVDGEEAFEVTVDAARLAEMIG